MNRLQAVHALGQSIWLDFISRELLSSGSLRRLIEDDAVTGLTSNPAIFEKAIGSSSDYDAALQALVEGGVSDPAELFERVAIDDIRAAADEFRKTYDGTRAVDGYVSLEVSPRLAHDSAGTIEQARRLWKAVGRDNLMIKVPGTPAGVDALRTLIGEGINVNVTLLFSREAYRAVAEAYVDGIEIWTQRSGDAGNIASVASFFVSRIDAAVDAEIARRVAAGDSDAARLQVLAGKVAIANARLAYQDYKAIFGSPRWLKLAQQYRARPQRLLWASTGTKNPQYRDTLYVEELIGANTVDTVPPATLDAFRDHGEARSTLELDIDAARAVFAEVEALQLPFSAIVDKLVDDGVQLFVDADDKLLAAVAGKRDLVAKA
ncbi:transaldolase [Solimonas marina]|uniref:Transaldolase n=1 Tax=Solimonas marina TaxID=2714601 RepID=A0A969WBU2_9GAMM|nr:transaldolase [Solimonas marina]NKF23654.1 transaldolase [Solimonas marina]